MRTRISCRRQSIDVLSCNSLALKSSGAQAHHERLEKAMRQCQWHRKTLETRKSWRKTAKGQSQASVSSFLCGNPYCTPHSTETSACKAGFDQLQASKTSIFHETFTPKLTIQASKTSIFHETFTKSDTSSFKKPFRSPKFVL